MHTIKKKDLIKLLEKLSSSYNVYVPKEKEDSLQYELFNPKTADEIVYQEIRTIQPLKAFFFPAQEKVATFFDNQSKEVQKPYCIVGAKRCNLQSLKVMDFVFKEGDFSDPGYEKLRTNNLIISSDCSTFKETCFCLALGIKPYPEENFDLNIAQFGNDEFLIEVGTSKGKDIINENKSLFREAEEADVAAREKARKELEGELEKHVQSKGIPSKDSLSSIVKNSFASDIWKKEVEPCVECGGCNHICPSCHCFILYERRGAGETSQRIRMWDSCQYSGFARVAGGANPRSKRYMRLRNRFNKKFVFFPEVLGEFGCSGCGRCIEVCPAEIDIREVLKKIK